MKTLDLPELFTQAGLNVVIMDGYEEPHTYGITPYKWRTDDPVCSMWHHTATSGYTPNRDKANMWAGLWSMETGRLYQSGGGLPTIVFANAYPAPISSGYGQRAVIDAAEADLPNDSLAMGSDDKNPAYAANRSAWNTEVVLDGIGTVIDEGVWEMITLAAKIMHEHFGWSEYRAIGHAQFTARKIDLRDGADPSARETMIRFRSAMVMIEEEEEVNYKAWAHGWFDSLSDEELELAEELDLFDGGSAWWKTIRDKGYEGRTEVENASVIHFRNTNEISGWGNVNLLKAQAEADA